MNDPAQAALLIVIVILTLLLLILGVQVFLILRDIRKTLSRANKVLEDASDITESVSGPVSALSSMMEGFKAGSSLAHFLKKRRKEDE